MCIYIYICMYVYMYICIYIYIHTYMRQSGGTKLATSVNMPLLRPQSSGDKLATYREIEPACRSFCRHGSCTFTEHGTAGAFWRKRSDSDLGLRRASSKPCLLLMRYADTVSERRNSDALVLPRNSSCLTRRRRGCWTKVHSDRRQEQTARRLDREEFSVHSSCRLLSSPFSPLLLLLCVGWTKVRGERDAA